MLLMSKWLVIALSCIWLVVDLSKILESLSASINDRGSTTLMFKNRNSPKSEPSSPPRSPNSVASFRTTNTPNSMTSPSKCKSEISFSKQMANRSQSIFSSSGTGLSQNMATILAMATMKEKLNSNNAAGAEIKPSVTITPSRLSPSLSSENGNSMNSSKCKPIHQIFTTA
ncbi:hypothetical protein V9T40_012846 [Parthenolecanium corni]|uniref:Uncharacterized protein n=1 Tax=Parthenolecanium corni TaxID=536013 RepID=A0AAN9T8I3_9HEMI